MNMKNVKQWQFYSSLLGMILFMIAGCVVWGVSQEISVAINTVAISDGFRNFYIDSQGVPFLVSISLLIVSVFLSKKWESAGWLPATLGLYCLFSGLMFIIAGISTDSKLIDALIAFIGLLTIGLMSLFGATQFTRIFTR